MNDLYGNKFIEKQRSSGYKSTIYAMAEIVDNSVDAKAKKIELILEEQTKVTGLRSSNLLSKIIFMDNGLGMSRKRINGCLTFSEGEGKSDSRIGAFGVGLPNSSISVGRKVEVYSKDEDNNWNYVFLDLDDQLIRDKPGYDPSVIKRPILNDVINIDSDIRTIVIWSKLDMVDAARASTIIDRAKKLLGRIYRYKIQEGLSILFSSYLKGNPRLDIDRERIIPYDPLFVMETENFITKEIWKWGLEQDPAGIHPELGKEEEFTSKFHYAKFIKGCSKNKTSLAVFQKYDNYWDVPYSVNFGGKEYKWIIKASFANSSITNPGIRNGGGTKIGKIFGEKMSGGGRKNFKSGNIFFLRANREIDYGSFGLYTVTNEKNRFWTIEIHFDSDLDELMGVSNTKQSVDFTPVKSEDLQTTGVYEDLSLGAQREVLWSQMTETIQRCIKGINTHLREYARNFKALEKSKLDETEEGKSPIPGVEDTVINVLPKAQEVWNEEKKQEISKFLKKTYMHLSMDAVKYQVELFSKGMSRTVVLYTANETNNLFELIEKRGVHITLINTNHIYYTNVIEPLKNSKRLKLFVVAIEMFISSSAIEMDRLILDNESKYKQPLNAYLLQLSSRLNEFILDSQIKIDPSKFENDDLDDLN